MNEFNKSQKNKRIARFLHERKAVTKKPNLLWKGREKEWAKEKYQNKLKEKEENESNGYVTKSMFELQFGWKDSGGWTVNPNKTYRKYIDKYEYFRGNHAQRERR